MIYDYIIINNLILSIQSIGEGNKFDYNITIHRPEKLRIGNDNFFGQNTYLIANGGIEIGNKCAIAADCKLVTRNHTYKDKNIPIIDQPHTYKSITIEDDCWLGYNVIILSGVTLGKGCIVAAGSIVTKSFPSYSIIAGVPANIIRKR
tara:strand:+ start:182 stop:625 length:444 start_codon:yes stop_codon:yes gene_type:complete